MKRKGLGIKIMLVILTLLIAFIGFIMKEVYISGITKAHDSSIFTELQNIKNIVEGKKGYNFTDINSFNEYFDSNIEFVNKCNYISSINEGNGFIFIFKLQYKSNIREYGNYYIYKSKEDYIIGEEEMEKIIILINKNCNY